MARLLWICFAGALGTAARYGIAVWASRTFPGPFPYGTLIVNLVGCFLIGVVMVLFVERWPHGSLARASLGTGVLGGFTTFSTYAVDARALLAAGEGALAAVYLLGSVVLGLTAVVVGLRLTERAIR